MLQKLLIQNVALIERAELEFSPGVNVLSGETGAGKSVILDAIDFVLGAKADRSLIRSGESFCAVRAEFSCSDPRVAALLVLTVLVIVAHSPLKWRLGFFHHKNQSTPTH